MQLVNFTLPIFLLILLGWLLAKTKIVTSQIAEQLAQYIFWVASPAIIFASISHYHLAQILAWKFTVAHILMICMTSLISYLIIKKQFNCHGNEAIMAGMVASVKNTIMIGLPLLISLVGSQAAIPMAITVVLFNMVLTPLLMLIFEINNAIQHAQTKLQIFLRVCSGLYRNPMVISALLGVIFAANHLKLPSILNTLVAYVAPSFIPCALFAVGVDLCFFNLQGNHLKLIFITLLSLLACPLCAVIFAYILKLSPFYATSLVVLASLPTAKSMYVYARKYQFFEKEAAAVISLTTILSLITIPFFIALCYELWPSAFIF